MGLEPRREHVMCKMVMVVLPPVVPPYENLDTMPRRLGIGVVPSVRMHEV